MTKNLKSNWRELVCLAIIVGLLFAGILSLGTREVSESGPASALASLVVSLMGGAAKFAAALALAWFALPWTFPEAGRFLLSNRFDFEWRHLGDRDKLTITLASVAVLILAAALCLASS